MLPVARTKRDTGLRSARTQNRSAAHADAQPGGMAVDLSICLQNLQHGSDQRRWRLLAERLGNAEPDVLLLNEALGWTDNDEELLKRAEADLGLTALRPLPSARSGHHVAILYRPDKLGEPRDYNTDFSDQFEHGVCVGVWALPGLPRPLSVTVTHLSPFSNADAFAEAEKTRWTALRHDKTDEPYAIIGADWNAAPLCGPAPELSRMYTRDRVTRFRDRACAEPNTDIAEYFDRAGFDDAGEVLYHLFDDERHLARTGRSDRIDRFLLTKALRPAVTGGGPLTVPAAAADHDGVSLVIDTALVGPGPR